MITSSAIALAERGLVPLSGLRLGIRSILARRLRELGSGDDLTEFARDLAAGPVALEVDKANEQHYEVPPEFFELVLGPHLKYSGAYWTDDTPDLAAAERTMLRMTCERAGLVDGQEVLELGCGWGSLTLYMAHAYPESRVTAVSNSTAQRLFIEERAPDNVRVITADMNDFDVEARFDRVVSVEMFEHMRNYDDLLRRIRGWLRPEGRLFVHVFCHREHAYPFETDGDDDWIGRNFFTGGIMPSWDLFGSFDRDMTIEQRWQVSGSHYCLTARAWRENLERRRAEVLRVLEKSYGAQAAVWYNRWRLFFLACEELFGYQGGEEWMVGHYRFAPKTRS